MLSASRLRAGKVSKGRVTGLPLINRLPRIIGRGIPTRFFTSAGNGQMAIEVRRPSIKNSHGVNSKSIYCRSVFHSTIVFRSNRSDQKSRVNLQRDNQSKIGIRNIVFARESDGCLRCFRARSELNPRIAEDAGSDNFLVGDFDNSAIELVGIHRVREF